ncbi:hypothetical protein [Roseimicrobium gellanilyticum]|uniref:hypothetical protein n=1 Tax=Roseimicrobium gellanilyticum TaxID=748857 RepID=UPI000DE8F0F7|nr:hypothetical protein [Roseimicrobium gellanilyticum]
MWLILIGVLLTSSAPWIHAGGLPAFESDQEAHLWLKENSPYYSLMAEEVEKRGDISFDVLENQKGGMVESGTGQGPGRILLAKELKGAARLSIHIFELTNAYQKRLHDEVDEKVRSGAIETPAEFGLLHELIEYDGLRYHRFVLAELNAVLDGGIPREMLTWINPKLTDLSSYELPLAFEYAKAQARSGHTAHYHEWFWRQKPAAPAR